MPRVWSIVFALSVALVCASPAAAFEDKVAVGAGPGYALWPGAPAAHGVGLDVHAGLGLSQSWQLRAGGAFAVHPHPAYALQTALLRAEIVYLIDIVDIVPFAGVGFGGLAAFDDERTELEPAAHLLLGAAYWLSFDWLLQLDVRGHLLPAEDRPEREPFYLASTLSVVLTFDR